MTKINSQIYTDIRDLGKKWFVLLIWFTILLILIQSLGIVVHEFGHYSTGKMFGCDNLTISIAKLSFQDSISNVSGWEYCKMPLVMAENGSRICNLKTNIISFAGFGISLIIFIPLMIFINLFFKRKYPNLYLQGHFFAIALMFTISMMIKSASYDLFKIGECLFNTSIGDIIFRLINIIPNILTLLIVMFFFIDLIKIIGLRIKLKQTSKKEVI